MKPKSNAGSVSFGEGCRDRRLLPSGETLVTACVADSSKVQMVRVLAAGADPNISNRYGDLPLTLVARTGDVELTSILLEHGADPCKCDSMGMTPLHVACLLNKQHIVDHLLEFGVPVNNKNQSTRCSLNSVSSPLRLAIENCSLNVVKSLLDAGADPNRTDCYGFSPFMRACQQGNFDTVVYMLSRGVDVNQVDKLGHTALTHAIINNRCTIAFHLLARGTDPNFALPQNSSVVAAIVANCKRCFNNVINFEADVHRILSNGMYPLHYALANISWNDQVMAYQASPSTLPNNLTNERIEFASRLIEMGVSVEPVWGTFLLRTTPSNAFPLLRGCNKVYQLCIQSFGFKITEETAVFYDNFVNSLIVSRHYKDLRLMLAAGMSPVSSTVWQNIEFQEKDSSDYEDYQSLLIEFHKLHRSPRCLQNLCVTTIRSCISDNVLYKAKLIDLPPLLQKMITLERPVLFVDY